MSVQYTNNPQQVVQVEPYQKDDDRQHLQSPGTRVPLDRMTSRLNPYEDVQGQLNEIKTNNSREERAERIKIRRIFDKVRRGNDFLQLLSTITRFSLFFL